MGFVLLYRGHKDDDFRRTRFKALCFFEDMKLAIEYGLGLNDAGNPEVADGFVTTVEFHGEVISVPHNGLAAVDRYIEAYEGRDAVKFKDGVVAVLDLAKLRNDRKVKASSLKL